MYNVYIIHHISSLSLKKIIQFTDPLDHKLKGKLNILQLIIKANIFIFRQLNGLCECFLN